VGWWEVLKNKQGKGKGKAAWLLADKSEKRAREQHTALVLK
jgi:hypothetical protein